MTSRFAQAILKHVSEVKTFTSNDIRSFFPNVNFVVIKESVDELVTEGLIYKYGIKRGTFYSIHKNLNEEEERENELHPKLVEEVKEFVLSKDSFISSDVFSAFQNHQEHVLRKVLIHFRDDLEIIFMHGYGKGSIWSKHKEFKKEEKPEEPEEQINLKEIILKFAKENLRWFKRSELDALCDDSTPGEIRQALYSLMDDGEILTRGERRTAEYAYSEIEESEIEESVNENINEELKIKIHSFIKETGIVTVPQLIEKFEENRKEIIKVLIILEEEEEIYHEGIKKSSKYIYKDVTQDKVEKIIKEKKKEDEANTVIEQREKAIDKLSLLAISGSTVYIHYINATNKYEIRSCNILNGGTQTLFADENPEETIIFFSTLLTKEKI